MASKVLVSACMVLLGPASPAYANVGCQQNGYHIVFARGSDANIGSSDAHAFRNHIRYLLPSATWAELGNLDGTVPDNNTAKPDQPNVEYPAVSFYNISPSYGASVEIGTRELIGYLNHRYSRGPVGQWCINETVILGGFSQGADVIGWAMEWRGPEGLRQSARDHIGYVALYGDPRYNRRCDRVHWWKRGDSTKPCDTNGQLGARDPYALEDYRYRFGGWCSDGDGFCNGSPVWGNHVDVYRQYWYQQSAAEVVASAKAKSRELTSSRIGVVDGNRTLWVKEGGLSASWTPVASNVATFRLSSSRIAYTQGTNLYINQGAVTAGFGLVAVNVREFAITDNRVGVLDLSGNLVAKEGSLGSSWTLLDRGVTSFDLSPRRVGALFGSNLYVKEGPLDAVWGVLIGSGVSTVRVTDSRIGALYGSSLHVKEGTPGSNWTLVANNVRSFSITGNRIGILDTTNKLYLKEGAVDAGWLPPVSGVTAFDLARNRVGVQIGSNFYVGDGLLGAPRPLVSNTAVIAGLSKAHPGP